MNPVGPLSMLAAAFMGIAAVYGGWAICLLWPALNLWGLAKAYARESPRPFGKQADGTLKGLPVFLYFPLLILTWGVWHLWRIATREPAFNRIDGTLFIGRRLLPDEPSPGAELSIDLTQEFAEPRRVRERAGYWSFPILDAAAPAPKKIVDMVLQLPPGRVLYVHCAQGHGRTGLMASAILLATGRAATAKEALERVRQARPAVRLSAGQLECLRECERLLKETDRPETPASDRHSARQEVTATTPPQS